ncbi:MAG: hypothetical protein A2W11_04940 [Ignavibacteria bacterium RBG_16_35_7]|nr:MAG: hypothetical protein A2W11_04940 [Ignavibacteria bacterium RBG_16_35_7]
MKYSILFIFFLFIQITLKAQVDTISFNSYFVLIEDNSMKVVDAKSELVFQKQFYRPYEYLADIDADQFDELIIVDSIITDGKLNITIYLFAGEENFKPIDSIYSGSFFPFITYSEEIESMIIETGIPEFEIFNQTSEASSLPINLWKVDNNELFLVNDELFEPFIFENANLSQLMDYYTHNKIMDCSTSQLYKGIIASSFANYINAGEQSLAAQIVKKYYVCEDVENFKQDIMDLIFPKAQ